MRLSLNQRQLCWMEEVPKISVLRVIRAISRKKQHGYFYRKNERIDYALSMKSRIIWFRYRGDKRFVSTWQSAFFRFDRVGNSGGSTAVTCPFCSSLVEEIWFFAKTLRCENCLWIEDRWKKQMDMTRSRRKKIQKGDLLSVAEGLSSGNPLEIYMTMVAMEMSGLSPRKLTTEKSPQKWVIERYKW